MSLFQCLECGRKFKTTQAAERASRNGCPKCNGVDIDLAPCDGYVPTLEAEQPDPAIEVTSGTYAEVQWAFLARNGYRYRDGFMVRGPLSVPVPAGERRAAGRYA